jgi:hypothetical protein
LRSRATIQIKVKLYVGLDSRARIASYDPQDGIDLDIKENTPVKKVLKRIGLKRQLSMVCFVNGEKEGFNYRLKQGDVVFLMKPASGG